MKHILFILLISPFIAFAQPKVLTVEGSSAEMYLTHTTGPKENYYSIGRIYNISPRVFVPFNKLQLETPLSIGQILKIPLTEQNYSADGVIGEDEVLVPLYYKAKPKETLSQISSRHNNISVISLKKWNNLSGENVTAGSNVIIGYLKVKKELSSLATRAVKVAPVTGTPTAANHSEPVVKNEPVIKSEPVKPEPVKTEPVKTEPVKTEPVKVQPEVKPVVAAVPTTSNVRSFNGGAFKSSYQSSGKNQSGIAGVFKSNSGWEDGKYYCLHNNANPGTIVKITNPANNKSIYAKVLDVIPDLRQNEGMQIRISNAAADELGVGATTFDCQINY